MKFSKILTDLVVCSFLVAMVKCSDESKLSKERFMLPYGSSGGLESIIAGKEWHSGRNQKLIYHIFITHRNREKEQEVE